VCLLLLLTSCATPAVRTETITVEKPVIVGVPAELTRVPPEPVLPPGALTNEDIVEDREAWRAWGLGLAEQLRKIAGLAPEPDGAP
jgi:hypothetical protein